MASNAQRVGITVLSAAPVPAITCTGRIAPENSTAGKHSIGRASVAWGTLPTVAEVSRPRPRAATEHSSQADARSRRTSRAGDWAGGPGAEARPASPDDQQQERHQDGHLRRHVGAEPQSDEVLAAQDRSLGADLQQAVGEPEEERGEDDPEADHHHRARARVLEVERARPEEDGEHADDHGRRADQDRERQAVAHERLQRPSGEDTPLGEPARHRSPVHRRVRYGVGRRHGSGRHGRVVIAVWIGQVAVELRHRADAVQLERLVDGADEAESPASCHAHDAIARSEVVDRVRGEHDRRRPVGEFAQAADQLGAGDRVEARRRLIQEEDVRVREQLDGDARAFALPSAQRADPDLGLIGQADGVERVTDRAIDLAPRLSTTGAGAAPRSGACVRGAGRRG